MEHHTHEYCVFLLIHTDLVGRPVQFKNMTVAAIAFEAAVQVCDSR